MVCCACRGMYGGCVGESGALGERVVEEEEGEGRGTELW